ncbi:MAG: ribosome maturation factor RimP [Lachnospiraceae bacterium]|nr:ribosome maturation factor RimP [Lachnospiraceae bacterium]
MGKKETIEEKTWALLGPVCEELGLLSVDAEYVKDREDYQLLIYIDKEGGVTIDDCEALSRRLDPMLDEEDFIDDAYTMIVSSPGLGRVIRRPRDFIFAKGKEVDVRTYKALDGSKELNGILKDFDKESIVLETEKSELTIQRSQIAQIRLTVHF